MCPRVLDDLAAVGQVTYEPHPSPERLLELLPDCDAYLGHLDRTIGQTQLEVAPNLRVVCTCSTGTDHWDVAALKARGIHRISLTTEYELLDRFTATAELAWGLLLSCRRLIPREFERSRRGEMWVDKSIALPEQLSEQTIGIVGLGRLGKMVARYAQGFGMHVLACDVKPIDMQGVTQVDFDTLLRESDVVTLHVHLRDDTRLMIDAAALAKMKRGVTLINVSRGELIDEAALLAALESGRVAAAGLDVIQNEWDENRVNHPLVQYARTHDNLILTPHIGGMSRTSITLAREHIAKKLIEHLTANHTAQV